MVSAKLHSLALGIIVALTKTVSETTHGHSHPDHDVVDGGFRHLELGGRLLRLVKGAEWHARGV